MDAKQLYTDLVKKGYSKKDAAKEAQEKTGVSVVTGRPIVKRVSETGESYVYGQYRIKK